MIVRDAEQIYQDMESPGKCGTVGSHTAAATSYHALYDVTVQVRVARDQLL